MLPSFREVFDLFDGNGGGTFDADELDQTLRSVDICLSKAEINEVLCTNNRQRWSAPYIYMYTHSNKLI